MKRNLIILFVVFSLMLPVLAQATFITFDEFDPRNDNSPLTDQYSYLGITFGSDNSGTWAGISNGDLGGWLLEGRKGSNFLGYNGVDNNDKCVTSIFFATPIGQVSFDVSRSNGSSEGQQLFAYAYNGAALLGATTVTLGDINEWTSLTMAYAGINKLILKNNQSVFNPYGIDNLQFSNVPIPTAAWLLGSGLVGLLGYRRKTYPYSS